MLICASAAFSPSASFFASSFAQECMKNKRGSSSSMWLWSAVDLDPVVALSALCDRVHLLGDQYEITCYGFALPPPVGWKLIALAEAHRRRHTHTPSYLIVFAARHNEIGTQPPLLVPFGLLQCPSSSAAMSRSIGPWRWSRRRGASGERCFAFRQRGVQCCSLASPGRRGPSHMHVHLKWLVGASRWLCSAVTLDSALDVAFSSPGSTSSMGQHQSPITMPLSPIVSNANQLPSAKPAFSSIPSSVTFRSVRGRPTR